jgi:hypothetical protein
MMRTESVELLVAVLLKGERERQRLSETRRFGAIGLRLCHPHDALDRYRWYGVPNGIRTRVLALKGPRPGPLDDGDVLARRAG